MRSAGILLHPTSLPSRFGIGDLGPAAHRWIETLSDTGTGIWQLLPLGPTGFGDSPYQCFSAFAGNPNLISPEILVEEGRLSHRDVDDFPSMPADFVDYGAVIPAKLGLLDRAYEGSTDVELTDFRHSKSHWIEDFGLFMALKDLHDGEPWWTWEVGLRDRHDDSLAEVRREHSALIDRHIFRQYIFFQQWDRLRALARERSVAIIGDAPIFVAEDSADVWVNRGLFFLDDDGRPTVVAGVPPDYFSPTGQLWGNPLYRWDVHRETGYRWWLARLRAVFNMFDYVRLDHFRGFAGYWEVPASDETAENGRWVPGPGSDFLEAVSAEFGQPPIIAEDLGEITPDVVELRDEFGLPGMKILQFAFDSGDTNDFLPHKYPESCVVYTGTHDNDTARGWYESADESDKDFARRYLNVDGSDFAWDLITAAWESRASLAVAPIQDLLNLETTARMNTPSVPTGNWQWRMTDGELTPGLQARLTALNRNTGRSPNRS